MEKITIIEKPETYDDKLKVYNMFDSPEVLVKLDEEYMREKINFIFVNSIDKLLDSVFKTSVFFIPTKKNPILYESEKPMAYKNSTAGPILYTIGQIEIGAIYTRAIEAKLEIDNIDLLLNKINPIYAQYEIPINMDVNNLYTRIYPDDTIKKNSIQLYHNKLYKWLKEFPIAVEGKNKIDDKRLVVPILKELDLKNTNTYVIEHLLVNFLINNNYKDLNKYIDKKREDAELYNEAQNIRTWNNFIKWIFNELKLEYKGSMLNYYKLSSIEQKLILKKKYLIKNIFLNPCNHNIYSADLKLDGDFYKCSHGNNIKCRHFTYPIVADLEDFFKEFSEPSPSGAIICRICGTELISDPEFFGVKSSISRKGIYEEINAYIFKKCINYLVNIKYSTTVSSAFVNKIAGNITDNILFIIIGIFNKIEKTKGVQENIIASMKEISLALYIYGSIIILIDKNNNLFSFKGSKKTTYKHIFNDGVEFLKKSIDGYLQKVKDIKTINIETSLQAVIEEIKSKDVAVPREFVKFNIKETVGYRYFENKGINMEGFPKLAKYDAEDEIIIKSLNNTLDIDEWHKYLKSVYKPVDYKIINITDIPHTKYKVPAYSNKYLGLIYGNKIKFHKHIFDFSQIALNKTIDKKICTICKEEPTMKDLSEEYKDVLIYKSKEIFFKNYCPKFIMHKFVKDKCACGYALQDNKEFIKKNELPKVSNFIFRKYEPVKYEFKEKNMSTIIPKYCGVLTKEQYKNFWEGFCTYEDTTYKDLISGKSGNKIIAIPKILAQYSNLITFIRMIGTTKKLQHLHTDENMEPLLKELKEVVDNSFYFNIGTEKKYDYLRNKFVEIYNKLPAEIMEFYFKELNKLASVGAMSEEHIKAEALISYKNKEVIDDAGEEEKEKNDLFTYEGFDYDGKNEKQ